MKKQHLQSLFLNLFVVTSFYCFGTSMMDYFLLYPTRGLVGEAEFAAYHQALEARIFPVLVYPFLLLTVLNILCVWYKPAAVPRKWILLSLALLVADWISTFAIQMPLNFQLSEGKNEAVLQQVMDSNRIRVALESAQVSLAFLLLWKSKKEKRASIIQPEAISYSQIF